MSFDARRLYELLPAVYRSRDTALGGPLEALLAVVAEEVGVLEENLEQLYDDQFLETCARWVVPYIGDLIGYRPLDRGTGGGSGRAEVGHTIAFRRRKGTATMLEQLAHDVTGWPARVVEFFSLLGVTQHMNHVRPHHWYAPDLRRWEPLERLHTPFETSAHTADVRRIAGGRGLYNISNVGIFLWRLRAYPLTMSPAVRVDEADDRRYLFSPLGHDMPLFTRPQIEEEITHVAGPLNVPARISRRVLDDALERYYGRDSRDRLRSLLVHRDGADVPASEIEVCDLSDVGATWGRQPTTKIAVDPVLGRLAFPRDPADPAHPPAPTEVRVTFHYGFAADVGGGEYDRSGSIDPDVETMPAGAHASIQAALDALATGGTVEIGDSGRYPGALTIRAEAADPAHRQVELRSADGTRPAIVLGAGDELVVRGAEGSEVTLNGLLITGGALRVPADPDNGLARLRLRHCTLVPGLALTHAGDPAHPGEASLVVERPGVSVEIDHCIVGGLRVSGTSDAALVRIADSIVDATADTGVAYAAPDGAGPGAPLEIVDSTVVGKVHALRLDEVSNAILLARSLAGDGWTAPVVAERLQQGCVRFSFVPTDARVPRRYRCQPENEDDALRVRPRFVSLRYGVPGYGLLAAGCSAAIRTGADDEGEMGAFHDLSHPQRERSLRVRLDEYLRVGLEAGVFYATDESRSVR